MGKIKISYILFGLSLFFALCLVSVFFIGLSSASSVNSFYGSLLNVTVTDYNLGDIISTGIFPNGVTYTASVGYVNYSGVIKDEYLEIYTLGDSFPLGGLVRQGIIVSSDNLTIMRLVRDCESLSASWNSDVRWNIDEDISKGNSVYSDFFRGEGLAMPAKQIIDFHSSYARYCAMNLSEKLFWANKLDNLGKKYDFDNPDFGIVSLIWGWKNYTKINTNVSAPPSNTSLVSGCTDSDNGKDIFTFGTVKLNNGNYVDQCEFQGNLGLGVWGVIEYFCENGSVKDEVIRCSGRCENGACVKDDVIDSCVDSDNGLNYSSAGYVITQGHIYTWDVCLGPEFSEPTLLERYCENEGLKTKDVICKEGCSNGACLSNLSLSNVSSRLVNTSILNSENFSSCELIGLRKNGSYCSLDAQWKIQKNESAFCDNNFECTSNLCVSGECISGSLFQRIIQWFLNLFG